MCMDYLGKSYLEYMEYAGAPANIDLPFPYFVSERFLAAII